MEWVLLTGSESPVTGGVLLEWQFKHLKGVELEDLSRFCQKCDVANFENSEIKVK